MGSVWIIGEEILIRISMGVGMGIVVGLTGMGVGVLLMGFLLGPGRMDFVEAAGTAALIQCFVRAISGLQHWRLGHIRWDLARCFLLGALPANFLAASFTVRYGMNQQVARTLQGLVTVIIAGVLLFMVGRLLCTTRWSLPGQESIPPRVGKRGVAVACGVLVGVLLGLTSIGGGIVIVPLLLLYFRLRGRDIAGTVTFIMLLISLLATVIHLATGAPNIPLALSLAMGSCLGVPLGGWLSSKLSERGHKIVIILVLIVSLGGLLLGGDLQRE